MPRYFFDVFDGVHSPDPDGTELADLSAVKSEAISTAGAMLRDIDGHLDTEWRMEVTDEGGRPVLSLRFSAIQHISADSMSD
jgi:hypothetical protein